MKTYKKIIIILLVISFVSVIFMNTYVLAGVDGSFITSNFGGTSGSDINSKAENAASSITNVMGIVLDVVRIACVGIALVLLTVVGAKYMLASPNERADIKQSLIVYVIGAIVMFSASGIVTIVRQFTDANVNAT